MAPPNNITPDYIFEDIFSTSMLDYDKQARNAGNLVDPKLEVSCTTIQTSLNASYLVNFFKSDCKRLIHYLDYIEHTKSSDKKRSCNYFNYLLKGVLTDSKCDMKNSKEAYKKMIELTKTGDVKKVSDVCITYFEDIDEDIYSVLKHLNELYLYFIMNGNICPLNTDCFNKYKELSKMCISAKNDSFCVLLNNFMQKNIENMMQNINIMEQKIKNMEQIIEEKELPAIPYHAYFTNTPTVILTLIIMLFTVLMITFFLYKYTPLGSFLQPTVSKIRNIWNNKNKDHLNIMDSSEFSHNDLFHNKYGIGWNYIGYK
ncbi:variable surface protein [Plasmodium gonderi]|uniref:Variable surface protein n=1 Tax=Plasmodium gonderi TaxID=77519 RepID=A0A1Y1JPE6_PLAGO|nr:variable surface protein [Plasmodium gonderi]GAW84476.1 variable surface protein [Plasmodium gonderi]